MGNSTATHFDVVAVGRVGVDLYPTLENVALDQVERFERSLGGSPTNVAVAAARQGLRSAIVTKVGDDPFAAFVRREVARLGVDPTWIGTEFGALTPVAFCERFPPDHFPLYFYRRGVVPDLQLTAVDLLHAEVLNAGIVWTTLTGLSRQPSRDAHFQLWDARDQQAGPTGWNILDLDYRPGFWDSAAEARAQAGAALNRVDVAIGNLQECWVAVGESTPERAADAILELGVRIAVVKLGPDGVLAKTADQSVRVPPVAAQVINGLGAGDAFGGALCAGLLGGKSLRSALEFANVAGAIVTEREACASAMPTTQEVFDRILSTAAAGSRSST